MCRWGPVGSGGVRCGPVGSGGVFSQTASVPPSRGDWCLVREQREQQTRLKSLKPRLNWVSWHEKGKIPAHVTKFQHVAQVCLHYFQRLFNVVILTQGILVRRRSIYFWNVIKGLLFSVTSYTYRYIRLYIDGLTKYPTGPHRATPDPTGPHRHN